MKKAADQTPSVPSLANLSIVLKSPKYHENVGAAARIAYNMGIGDVRVVHDCCLDMEKVRRMATHNATELIENMVIFRSLREALQPFSVVIGTSARLGRQRRTVRNPREMVAHVLPYLLNNRVALLFGPEDRGLKNEDLRYCQITVHIPTADFSSLNLAQAVAILSHELYTGLLDRSSQPLHPLPKLAESRELEGMYQHMEEALARIGFLQQENHRYWMQSIRQFLGRIGLKSKEVRLIRGLCRQFLWYEKNGRKMVQERDVKR